MSEKSERDERIRMGHLLNRAQQDVKELRSRVAEVGELKGELGAYREESIEHEAEIRKLEKKNETLRDKVLELTNENSDLREAL